MQNNESGKCPICNSLFENCGAERFTDKYWIVYCNQCGFEFYKE